MSERVSIFIHKGVVLWAVSAASRLIGENYRRIVTPVITDLDVGTWQQRGSGGQALDVLLVGPSRSVFKRYPTHTLLKIGVKIWSHRHSPSAFRLLDRQNATSPGTQTSSGLSPKIRAQTFGLWELPNSFLRMPNSSLFSFFGWRYVPILSGGLLGISRRWWNETGGTAWHSYHLVGRLLETSCRLRCTDGGLGWRKSGPVLEARLYPETKPMKNW